MRIILCKGNGRVSRLIRWFTRGEYSHAALLFSDNVVIEAHAQHGVQHLYLSTWMVLNPQAGADIYELDLTPEQEAVVRAYAMVQVGKPYDWIGDLHFVTRQDYEQQPDDKWFCSELVFESIGQVLWLFARTRGWQVAPDLLKRSKDLKL